MRPRAKLLELAFELAILATRKPLMLRSAVGLHGALRNI